MSLRVRLLFMTLLVLLIVVAAVALLSGQATVHQFERYLETDVATRLDRSQTAVTLYYERRGSWAGIDSVLTSISRLNDQPLLLIGREGTPLASTAVDLKGSQVSVAADHTVRIESTHRKGGLSERRFMMVNGPHIVLKDALGAPIGTLYLIPREPREGETHFRVGVGRSLLVAALFAGLVGVVLTLGVSQRILSPVGALTRAARRMQSGDFSSRVPIGSKDEIGQLAEAFNEMADDIVRIEGLRRKMVGDVAHELRTPLTNIRCQIEALQDGLIEATPATVDSLHDEVLLLNRLIDDLQELAVAEAGQLSLLPEPVAVDAEIRRAVSASEPRARAAGVRLTTSCPDGLPPAFADSRRVGQVLRNLLDNALTHTPPGGVVETSARAEDGKIRVAVTDTGSGIPPEHLANVFERFYRADESRSRGTGGFGLGLAIVKQLVEAQGGTIRVESEPGQGTTFTFTLPIAPDS
jgi:signal transduction histidine kinase